MFTSRYFNPRYWAARYWPKVGGVIDPVLWPTVINNVKVRSIEKINVFNKTEEITIRSKTNEITIRSIS